MRISVKIQHGYMNNLQGYAQREIIKALLKQVIQNDPRLTSQQKLITIESIDRAAERAD